MSTTNQKEFLSKAHSNNYIFEFNVDDNESLIKEVEDLPPQDCLSMRKQSPSKTCMVFD